MDLKNAAGVVLLSIAVVACGGGGGSAPPPTGGGGGGGGGGTPPPPPPPPPPITYTKYADLTGDQTFKTACGGIFAANQIIPAFGFGQTSTFPQFMDLGFTASTQTWRMNTTAVNGDPIDISFGPTDITSPAGAEVTQYARADTGGFTNRFSLAGQPPAGLTREYIRGLRLFTRPTTTSAFSDYWCVFGVPTRLEDRLPTTTITYNSFSVRGTAVVSNGAQAGQYDLSDSTVTLSANPANGQIPAQVRLVGRQFTPTGLSTTQTDLGTFSGTATVDGQSQNFNAGFDQSNRALAGPHGFGGWFFGPQGIEAGFGFSIQFNQPTGEAVLATGAVTARR